jgi:hypothetical protein
MLSVAWELSGLRMASAQVRTCVEARDQALERTPPGVVFRYCRGSRDHSAHSKAQQAGFPHRGMENEAADARPDRFCRSDHSGSTVIGRTLTLT